MRPRSAPLCRRHRRALAQLLTAVGERRALRDLDVTKLTLYAALGGRPVYARTARAVSRALRTAGLLPPEPAPKRSSAQVAP